MHCTGDVVGGCSPELNVKFTFLGCPVLDGTSTCLKPPQGSLPERKDQ